MFARHTYSKLPSNMKLLKVMSKIRNYLIHLFGGVTKEECHRKVLYYSKEAQSHTMQCLMFRMEDYYNMSDEEWRKSIYEYTCEEYEQTLKDLEEYADGLND